MSDLKGRIEHDENSFQKLAAAIPGFKGYREQEIRRTADRLLRDHLVKLMDASRNKLQRQLREADISDLEMTAKIERAERRLTALRDRLDHASYGESGLFDAIKVQAEELDRMYDYDRSLMDNIGAIDGIVEQMADADDMPELLSNLQDELDSFDQMLDDRAEVIRDIVPGDPGE
jgi:hypothetical protein